MTYRRNKKTGKNKSNSSAKKEDQISGNRNVFFYGAKTVWNLGFSMVVPLVSGAYLGSYLDRYFATAPRFTLSLILLGLSIGIYSMYRELKDYFK